MKLASVISPDRKNLYLLFLLFLLSVHYGYLVDDCYQMDFRAFYVAAKSFINGLNPYYNNVVISEEYFDSNRLETTSRFFYPPTALLFLFPFGLLSYAQSKFIFSFINWAALISILLMMKKRYDIKSEYILLIFMSFPVLAHFERGQIDIIILFLIIFSYYNKARWFSGLALAITVAIKLIPCLLLLYFLYKKEYPIILSTLFFIAVFVFGGILFIDSSFYVDFFNCLFTDKLANESILMPAPEHYRLTLNTIVSPEGKFTFNHNYIHGLLNPLYYAGAYIYVISLSILLFYIYISRKFLTMDDEEKFFTFLILMMSANKLLWIMGLVWYIPLAFRYLKEKTSFIETVLIFLPLYFPAAVRHNHIFMNYILVIITVSYFHYKKIRTQGFSCAGLN